MSFLINLDNSILEIFSRTIKNSFFDTIMPIITNSNNHGEIWAVIALILIFSRKKEMKTIGFTMILALVIGYILGEAALKHLVGRTRPIMGVEDYRFLIELPKSYSFPSGHTTSSFACFGVFFFNKSRYKYYVLILSLTIAFSRLYLHVHYPSDVLGGMALGIVSAKLAVMLNNYIISRRDRDGEQNKNI